MAHLLDFSPFALVCRLKQTVTHFFKTIQFSMDLPPWYGLKKKTVAGMKHWGTMSLDSATGDHSEKNVSNPCCFQKAFYLLILFNLFGSKMSWNVLNRTIPYFLSKFSHMLKPSQNIALPNCHVSHDILLLESPYPFVGPSDIPTHVFLNAQASLAPTPVSP